MTIELQRQVLPAVDFTSGLLDLTSIPLRELRGLRSPALASAIQRTIDDAARENATDIQEQRTLPEGSTHGGRRLD